MDSNVPVLECRGLNKSFGTVHALIDVDFALRRGEVRALLGKNGAGKSTLVNVVSGSLQPDSGQILLSGNEVTWDSPGAARAGGISVVHQEFSLVPGLTVAENITMGRWPTQAAGFINADKLQTEARRALELLGVDLPTWALVGNLPIAQQQLVEIAKALVDNPEVLILDEPTSALNAAEVDTLLSLVRRLAATGVAIIYVSHRMKEIPQVADRMTVMRDGRVVDTIGVDEADAERVAAMIAGEVAKVHEVVWQDRSDSPVVLSVRGLAVPGVLEDVSLELHEGEVLGIAGFLGSGRTELLEAIYGLRPAGGEVRVAGALVRRRTPRRLLARKVALTSEDRKRAGIVPALGVGENVVLSARGRVLPRFWLRRRREAALQAAIISKLDVRASGPAQEVGTLSGGNQQKAVIGRALAAQMRVLLLDEPTRGIDIHAKTQIYALIRELARDGVASIFVSSELEEMQLVCDRVIILRSGHNREEVHGAQASPERILALAMKEED